MNEKYLALAAYLAQMAAKKWVEEQRATGDKPEFTTSNEADSGSQTDPKTDARRPRRRNRAKKK